MKSWRIEERAWVSTRRIFDKKVGRKSFTDVESVRSGQIFHVPIQPALFPLPREPGGLQSRGYKICSTHGISGNVFANPQASSSTSYQGMLKPLNWFLHYGKYSGASKHGETRDRKWWSRQQQILSQMAEIPNIFSIFSSNFWFLKRSPTGILTLFQKECI